MQQQFNINANYCVSVRYSYACSKITELLLNVRQMENVKKSEKYSCVATCPMRNVIAHFANKWSMLLLVILDEFGVMRFNELSRAIPDISPKVLSGHLKTLEAIGLVRRVLYAEVPPRVEYDLTELGMTLIPILNELSEWGREHLEDVSGNLAKKVVD